MELVLFGHALSKYIELYSFFLEELCDCFAMQFPNSVGFLCGLVPTRSTHNERQGTMEVEMSEQSESRQDA
jgi:hypothetical protein